MDISDKVAEIVDDVITETAEWEYHTEYDPSVGIDDAWGLITNLSELSKEVAQAVITAYLNIIKHTFDMDDESTWPKDDGDEYYLCEIEGSKPDMMQWHGEAYVHLWQCVTHYLDPADIMPEENK